MVEVNRKDIIITAYSMEEVATPIWSDLFSECGLKFSLKNGGLLRFLLLFSKLSIRSWYTCHFQLSRVMSFRITFVYHLPVLAVNW